jgi:phosphotriesterase-related protein
MSNRSEPGQVMTVRGAVSSDEIGTTLMHEHLFADLTVWFAGREEYQADFERPVDMSMLGQLRRDAFSVTRDNLRLTSATVAAVEAERFLSAGGNTILDLSPPGIGRNPDGLRSLAEDKDFNVVMGCGYYVEAAHPPEVRTMTIDDIAQSLIAEITGGVGSTGIRPGIIGEVGTSGVDSATGQKIGHVTEQEERVLRGCARAALETGVAVSVHLDPRGEGGDQVLDILESETLNPSRVVLGHLDHVPNLDYHRRLADRGAYLQYDSFGREYYWEAADVYWGNDAWRIASLATLIGEGYTDQLLVSQDVCFKMDLRTYGGYGYDHILVDVIPALRRAGVSQSSLESLMTMNPRDVLTLRIPAPL